MTIDQIERIQGFLIRYVDVALLFGLGDCDIIMSHAYLDETLAFVVRDHLRHDFNTWEQIRSIRELELGVPNVPYYIAKLKEAIPNAKFIVKRNASEAFADGLDVLALPAERGSTWTILHPDYSVVVPQPGGP